MEQSGQLIYKIKSKKEKKKYLSVREKTNIEAHFFTATT